MRLNSPFKYGHPKTAINPPLMAMSATAPETIRRRVVVLLRDHQVLFERVGGAEV
jgi:hypothetical protein